MIEAFDSLAAKYEQEIEELHAEIARLQRENRILRGRDAEGETGIISRVQEARNYDNQPPLNDGLDDYLWEQAGDDD